MRVPALASILLSTITLFVNPANADEWYLQPSVQERTLANDNVTLNRSKKQPVVGGILSPQLRIGHRSETLDFNLTGRTDLNGYIVNSQLSTVDTRAQFQGTYTGELSRLSLNAEYNRDTIFNDIEDSSGSSEQAIRTMTTTVTPAWSYEITELDQINLSARYFDRSYGQSQKEHTDYTSYSASANWQHRLSPTDAVSVGGSYTRFLPDDQSNTKENIYNLNFGWTHEFSERFHFEASAGPSLTDKTSEAPNSQENGGQTSDLTYNANLLASYQINDLTRFVASYSRKSEPTSNGTTKDRDRVALTLDYRATESVTLSMHAAYTGNESGSSRSQNGSFKRLISLEPSIAWQIDEDVDLSLSYRFLQKTFKSPSDTAESNAVFLTLTYRPEEWLWSD